MDNELVISAEGWLSPSVRVVRMRVSVRGVTVGFPYMYYIGKVEEGAICTFDLQKRREVRWKKDQKKMKMYELKSSYTNGRMAMNQYRGRKRGVEKGNMG